MTSLLQRYSLGAVKVAAFLLVLWLLLFGVATFVDTLQTPPFTPVPATVSPKVSKLETTTVQPKSVVVYEPRAKQKLGLDAATVANPSKHVLASSKLGANVRPSTVTTVLDESTGESATHVTVDPYPWLGANRSGSLSLSYGFRSGTPVARMVVTQDVLQLKALHFTGIGTLDSDGQYYAGAGVTYKW